MNVDHVATVRQARKTYEPDPVHAAYLAELGGADSITIHLREDRRHIQDRDLRVLMDTATTPVNLELASVPEVLDLACAARPAQATLVPERREEVTTEGGLDVVGQRELVARAVDRLRSAGVRVSLFIDPEPIQIEASAAVGVEAVEFHTGGYAHAFARGGEALDELAKQRAGFLAAASLGLRVHAGHGLNYQNVSELAQLPAVEELNIGHSIVARALWVGFEGAVREMKRLIQEAADRRSR